VRSNTPTKVSRPMSETKIATTITKDHSGWGSWVLWVVAIEP
jgi:hypothetical protein